MLLQKCHVESDDKGKRVFIKGMRLNGTLETTENYEEAMIWPKRYWGMFLEETDLAKYDPLFVDINPFQAARGIAPALNISLPKDKGLV